MKFLRAIAVATACVCFSAGIAHADADDLRQRAEAPVPDGLLVEQLHKLYTDKVDAAHQLGDVVLRERLLREAVDRLPSPRWPNDLAGVMRDSGKLDEAIRLYDLAVLRSQRDGDRVFYMANRLSVPVKRTAESLQQDALALRQKAQAALRPLGPGTSRVSATRALAMSHMLEANALARMGRWGDSLAAYIAAHASARVALDEAIGLSPPSAGQRLHAAGTLAAALRDLAAAQTRMGLHVDAESTLDSLLALVREHTLSPAWEASVRSLVAGLRLRRAEYDDAERQLRASQQVLDRLLYAPAHPFQSQRRRDLINTLWAAGRHEAAASELRLHDEVMQADPAAKQLARFPFERGLVLMGMQSPADAAPEFARVARGNRADLGDAHYYTLQAQALEGAALWRTQDAAKRDRGADLLGGTVPAMMDPRHAEFHDDAYARKPIRALVFDAYLDAMASRGGAAAAAAIGIGDRLLAGATSQAMTDAALRAAAAGEPDLAALVRREQDARALVASLLDELRAPVAALEPDAVPLETGDMKTMRERLAAAEAQLSATQRELRQRFPAFDRLLRPALATPADVAAALKPDEALLLALPTEHNLLLWLVTPGAPPRFVRVPVARATLVDQVQLLRQGFDFAAGRRPNFDPALAHELYRTVLAPVADALPQGTHLVIATTGPLAALPFPALISEPPHDGKAGRSQGGRTPSGRGELRGMGPDAAWVARRWATSQVPSIAAWLALRQLPPAAAAREPLIAWADPAYARASTATAATTAISSREGARATAALPPLPETRAEVAAIAAALKAEPDRDLHLGAQATRESVLAASASGELARKRVVVFATHGLTAGDLPGLNQPALALAPPPGATEPTAGLMGLDDILGLKLGADWVVLSACNTAASDGQAEQALSGLARGFLHAGGRTLLVTHWAVETESAKQLSIATFEHHASHASGGLPQGRSQGAPVPSGKAESLRQAMLKVMSMPAFDHPAYWAPFVLVGDGGR